MTDAEYLNILGTKRRKRRSRRKRECIKLRIKNYHNHLPTFLAKDYICANGGVPKILYINSIYSQKPIRLRQVTNYPQLSAFDGSFLATSSLFIICPLHQNQG